MFAKSTEGGTQELRRLGQLFADRTHGGQADGSRSGAAMSGAKDSGRERGNGDIDANDPSRHFVQQLRPAISIALSALAVLAMTAFIILSDLTTVCLEPA